MTKTASDPTHTKGGSVRVPPSHYQPLLRLRGLRVAQGEINLAAQALVVEALDLLFAKLTPEERKKIGLK